MNTRTGLRDTTLGSVPATTIALILIATAPATLADWPQWGGPDRSFVVERKTDIAPWPEAGPPLVWQRELGPGFATAVVDDGRVITVYRRVGRDGKEQDVVLAVAAATGKTLWERAYSGPVVDKDAVDTSYGSGPNSTPLIADGKVYTLGYGGVVHCTRAKDGMPLWSRSLTAEGVPTPYFGHAASPIRYRESVVVVAGGVHAYDLDTGEQRWSNTDFDGSYASPLLVAQGSNEFLLIAGAGVIVGVDPVNGKTLWSHDHINQHRTILCSPVVGDDDWVFVSAFYIGSIGLQLSDDGRAVTRRWENPKMQISYSNAVRDGDWVYGFHNSILSAVHVKTGEFGWRERGIRRANILKVGDRYLILDHLGRLLLTSLTPEGLTIHADAQVVEGRTWSAPTLHGDTLFIRTEDSLLAFDLSGKAAGRSRETAVADAGPVKTPAGFLEAKQQLSAAIYANDPAKLEAAQARFASWADAGQAGHLAPYYAGLAAWYGSLAVEGKRALALLDQAVEHVKRALTLHPRFADAHALLSPLYGHYYRLDRGRAAIIGPMGDEHLNIALLQEPTNPRVVAAQAVDLITSPVEYGGDPETGMKRLREALALFADAPKENSGVTPDHGHVEALEIYGMALLQQATPDRAAARAAFLQALQIRPDSKLAASQLQALDALSD